MRTFKPLLLITITGLTLALSGCIDGVNLRSVSTLKGYGREMTPKFIAHGANSVDVAQIVRQLDIAPTDNWTIAWGAKADEYEERSIRFIEQNNLDDARYLLLRSVIYNRIAAYPYPVDDTRKERYSKAVRLFTQYTKFLNSPPEVISLSMETKRITGYLRTARDNQRAPLVILLPGLDSNKEEMFWIEDHFLDRGFATFSMDIPGTGESEWSMRNDSARMIQRVINFFGQESSIYPDKIFIVGFDFGGYWALRMAAQNNKIAGVVAVAPPIHHTFNKHHMNNMPRFLAEIFKQATGAIDYPDMFDILEAMSLKEQDLLRDIKCPLFIINSDNNFLIPKKEIDFLSHELARPISVKLYKDQPYGIINNLQSEVYPMIANWLEKEAGKK